MPGLDLAWRIGEGAMTLVLDPTKIKAAFKEFSEAGFQGPLIVKSNLNQLWGLSKKDPDRYTQALRSVGQAILELEEKLGVAIILSYSDEVLKDTALREDYESMVGPAVGIPAPQGNVFDDTDGSGSTMGMSFVDLRDGSRLSTRHWGAYREGYDDLRYVATLEQVLAESEVDTDATRQARAFLAELADDWWPTGPYLEGRRAWRGAIVRTLNAQHPLGSLDEARGQLAMHILAVLGESYLRHLARYRGHRL